MTIRLTAVGVCMLLLLTAIVSASPAPLRVAIVPLRTYGVQNLGDLQAALTEVLSSRLSGEVGISLIDSAVVMQAAEKESGSLQSEGTLRRIGQSVGADAVVSVSLTVVGDRFSLDARTVDSSGGQSTQSSFAEGVYSAELLLKVGELAKAIATVLSGWHPENREAAGQVKPVPEAGAPSGPGEAIPGGKASGGEFAGMEPLNTALVGVAIGDVDGNGRAETVVVDERNVFVYAYDGAFRLLSRWGGQSNDHFLAVDVADLNGNGQAEIFISNYDQIGLRSLVLEMRGTALQVITDKLPYYLRIEQSPDHGARLLGQKMTVQEPFDRTIRVLVPKGRKGFSAGDARAELEDVQVFSFAEGDLAGDGSSLIVALSHNDRLGVFDQTGESIWVSNEFYGGSANVLQFPSKVGRDDVDRPELVVRNRIILKDVNGDGKDDVVVPQNVSSTQRWLRNFRYFSSSYVHCLSWDGIGLDPIWSSKEVDGYAADLALGDIDGDKKDELVVAVVRDLDFKGLSTPRSVLLLYRI